MDKAWQERVEHKLDNVLERVVRLETQSTWKVKLLVVLGGLLGTIATLLASNGCGGPQRAPGYSSPEVQAQYESAVSVEVTCIFPEPKTPDELLAILFGGGSRWGSGVAVGSNTLVTARHVVDCELELPDDKILKGTAWEIVVKTHDGRMEEAVVSAEGLDASQDVAVLSVVAGREFFKTYATVSERLPDVGEQVCVMAARPFVSRRCGDVSNYRLIEEGWMGKGYFIYDAPSDPGNSGSGVFDSSGKVIAVHVASVGRHAGGGYLAKYWKHLIPPDLSWYEQDPI